MGNIYEELKKQARDNQARWNKIEDILKHMKSSLKQGNDIWEDELIECLELLVQNLKPPVNVEGEIADLEKSFDGLGKLFAAGKK